MENNRNKSEEDFKKSLKNKKIPILTLDAKWHQLFPESEKTKEIINLENNLNNLIKRQGQLNNDIKDLKKLKIGLMDGIVHNMDGTMDEDSIMAKKLDEQQRLIKEINEKLNIYQDELLDIPALLKEANEKLMVASMELCYHKLYDNSTEISNIEAWIKELRVELKRKILIKQDKEIKNQQMYSYMHDIFGPEVIDIFDITYDEKLQTKE